MATVSSAAKDEALAFASDRLVEKSDELLNANVQDVARCGGGGWSAGGRGPAQADRDAGCSNGPRAAHGHGVARSRRGGRGGLRPAQRASRRAGPGPARRRRDHLREPPERHRRCRSAVSQVRQCRVPAGIGGGPGIQPSRRLVASRGDREGRTSCRRSPARRGHFAQDGRGVRPAPGRHRLPDPPRRPGPALDDPRVRHGPLRARRRRQLPRLCGRGRRPRHGREHRRQRQDSAAERVQRRRDPPRPPGRRRRVPAEDAPRRWPASSSPRTSARGRSCLAHALRPRRTSPGNSSGSSWRSESSTTSTPPSRTSPASVLGTQRRSSRRTSRLRHAL